MFRFYRRVRRFGLFFLISLVFCWMVNALPIWQVNGKVTAQSPPSPQLVKHGIDRYKAGKFTEAIALWQQALPQISAVKDRAVVYSNLAQAYDQVGQPDQAIAQWEQAIQIYRSQDDYASRHLLAQLLAEQAQAYSDLGQHQRAITLSQSADAIARKNQDKLAIAAAQGGLGNAHWALGNYEQALAAHRTSLKIARQLRNPSYVTTALNNIGNVFTRRAERYRFQANAARLEGDRQEETRLTQLAERDTAAALDAFEQSVRESQALGGLAEVRALLNLNHLLQQSASPQLDKIATNQSQVLALLEAQPDSRDKAYALINLAASLRPRESSQYLEPSRMAELLEKGITTAKAIGDRRAESFAVGTLGQMYESLNQYEKAMALTRQAQFAAQQVNAADSLYRWQWQAGRILKATGETQQATTAYQQAIATLQSIRGDIVTANRDLQFDFRDAVEPVYRELIALLLEPVAVVNASTQVQIAPVPPQNISKALDTSELLKLAELQNFFGDECVQLALDSAKSNGSLGDTKAAVIYSVILEDRTEMILQSPDGSLTRYPVRMRVQEMQQEIDRLRLLLEKRATDEYLPQAQKVYDALIRPLEADLAAAKPNTLIFVNDGALRKVPMAALHDGKQFLIQKYPVATTPSLSLTTREPLDRSNLQALILGLTIERPPFPALENVTDEATSVQNILTGTTLLNQEFTLPQLEAQLEEESYPIVHVATHGKFGVDAASTFLLGFNSQISIEEIDNLLRSSKSRQPVELLTLSACQTAAGDNRSALGIAGVAVRAGVKSALASLWFINDEATVPLIEEFYTQLRQPDVTKAEALRRAQIKMIADLDNSHPAVWSPFILIGNWL